MANKSQKPLETKEQCVTQSDLDFDSSAQHLQGH